jgi:hypothetical protein
MPALVKKKKEVEGSEGIEEVKEQEQELNQVQEERTEADKPVHESGRGGWPSYKETDNPKAVKAREERQATGKGTYKSELRVFRDQILTTLDSNLTDEEMAEDLGVTLARFQGQKKKLFDTTEEDYTGSGVHTFVTFCLQQNAFKSELKVIYEEMKKAKRWRECIACIKLQSQIVQNTMDQAMEMGVVKRQAKEVHVVGSRDVSNLSMKEISAEFNKELDGFRGMMRAVSIDCNAPRGSKTLKELTQTRDAVALSEVVSKENKTSE